MGYCWSCVISTSLYCLSYLLCFVKRDISSSFLYNTKDLILVYLDDSGALLISIMMSEAVFAAPTSVITRTKTGGYISTSYTTPVLSSYTVAASPMTSASTSSTPTFSNIIFGEYRADAL